MTEAEPTTETERTDSEIPEYAQGFDHPDLPEGWNHSDRPRASPIADCVARYRLGESAVQVVIYEMYNDGLDTYGVGVYTERECRDAASASIQAEAAEIARNMMLTESEHRVIQEG